MFYMSSPETAHWMEPDAEVDSVLLEKFEREVWDKMPHLDGDAVRGATPMADITGDVRECARQVYGAGLPDDIRVWAKFDSGLPGGSIKARPAAYILRDAIRNGKLKTGQTIIEATSGNFGIALGEMSRLGLGVISLVSRRLQEGVIDGLKIGNAKTIDLDMDVCPAPGMEGSADMVAAKAAAASVRSKLAGMGFDPAAFDEILPEAVDLLVKQDIINLAKLVARAYGLFCTEQYDNGLNVEAHRTITAPEMDQQLGERGESLGEYDVFCSFGTGGTSGGICRYVFERYKKRSVHVVYPVAGQDVAGIRTKAKADGLSLYRPAEYAREHEVNFEDARPLMRFFVERGHDMGESSALALYAAMRAAISGEGIKFVVMAADGVEKYRKDMIPEQQTQISLDDAAAGADRYDRIVWVHAQYTPRDEGLNVIAKSLGVDKSRITVLKASTVGKMLTTRSVPEEMRRDMEGAKGKSLLVCMAGKTSLMAAKVLASNGIVTQSLEGGITDLPASRGRSPGELITLATE